MNKQVAIQEPDAVTIACAAYAAETQASAIAGDLLAFRKGTWQRGENKDTVPAEATFVANMAHIWRGWIRWNDGKPVEHRLVPVGERPPDRNELGHFDEAKWEIGNDGNPRDPWAPTDRIVLRESSDGELSLLTFSTGSFGGRQALGKLCQAYAQRSAKHAGAYPVVRLTSDTWKHKEYGDIPKPVFEVVGWEPWDLHQGEFPLGSEPEPDADGGPANLGPPKDGPDDKLTSFAP